jgi:putative ABC transport system substrate-binding protein
VNRRRAIKALGALSTGLCSIGAVGQEKAKIRRIGFHGSGSAQSMPGALEAFRQGMTALRWIEGRDYFIDARYADNRPEASERIAAELVTAQPDLLLAPGDSSTRALVRKTKTIPIVFAISSDPVGAGYAVSLHRPGGNVTGLTSLARDLAAKRLQLLREVYPNATHVGLLFNPGEQQSARQVKAYEDTAARFNMRISSLEMRQSKDIEAAVRRGVELGVEAFALTQGPLLNSNRSTVSEALISLKRPAIAPFSQDADAGVLMAYAPDIREHFRLVAGYADSILKGAKPGDLAIGQPTKLELVINLNTAKTLGVTIPSSVLVRADRVIQ